MLALAMMLLGRDHWTSRIAVTGDWRCVKLMIVWGGR